MGNTVWHEQVTRIETTNHSLCMYILTFYLSIYLSIHLRSSFPFKHLRLHLASLERGLYGGRNNLPVWHLILWHLSHLLLCLCRIVNEINWNPVLAEQNKGRVLCIMLQPLGRHATIQTSPTTLKHTASVSSCSLRLKVAANHFSWLDSNINFDRNLGTLIWKNAS